MFLDWLLKLKAMVALYGVSIALSPRPCMREKACSGVRFHFCVLEGLGFAAVE